LRQQSLPGHIRHFVGARAFAAPKRLRPRRRVKSAHDGNILNSK
jgi:hypothetical protein